MGAAPQGMNTAGQELRLRAIGLGRVLNIPHSAFAARERQAYAILSHLAAMPTKADKSERRRYGIEILENTEKLFPRAQPQNAQFAGKVSGLVIEMQEFPAWFTKLTKSNEDIVDDYVMVKTILIGMKYAGMGALSGMAGVSSGAIKGGAKAAQAVAGQGVRTVGGAAVRGAATGARAAVSGGLAGTMGVVWVVGSMTYVALEARQKELGDEITRRYQERRMDPALYQRVFGGEVALPERYFYDVR